MPLRPRVPAPFLNTGDVHNVEIVTTRVSPELGGGFMRQETTGIVPYLEYSALTRCQFQVSFMTRTTILILLAGSVLLRNEEK